MICRMMEALRPSVNLTSPESRRPCKVVESEKLAGDVFATLTYHEIVFHEVENEIEGALVFPGSLFYEKHIFG